MKITFIIASLIIAVGFTSTSTFAQSKQTQKIKIFLLRDNPDIDTDVVAVERTIPKTTRLADAAMRELLKGATAEENKRGLITLFEPSSIVTGREECTGDKIGPLAQYYIGVTIKRGVAILNFRKGALCYFDTAISQATRTMSPIEATMTQFKSIKSVEYAINGKIITEWDA